jgi:omega-6 fatty acid desaturase (delta-12 desaturase)
MERIQIDTNLIKSFQKYTKTNTTKATIQIINSFLPFIGIWILMYFAYDYSYWLTFGLGVLNAFFLVRIFIIQHDCGHRTFLSNSKARDIVGYACSIFSTIPYTYWAKSHHIHHSHNGQLDLRDIGDIDTLTVSEYKQLSTAGKLKYRLYRSWLVMFLIGPLYYVLVHNRLPLIKMDVFKNEKWKLWINNLILTGLFILLGYYLGWAKFFITHFTIVAIFSVIAIWFFYVQHQHEAAYKQWKDKWDYLTAALKGSTYYKIPPVFNWLTGNIGIHHIHHLNPAIPNYNLQQALAENPWVNKYSTIVGFWGSLKLATHKLWDESQQRMITFAEFRERERLGLI